LGLLDSVEITGVLPRRVALERIKEADVCISPFRPSPALDVASPTKLVEYMALGLPVVANSHPDQTHVLRQSRSGVCVPWGAGYFARGIHWIARRTDEELERMSYRGRDWVSANRSYTRIADAFERACRLERSSL
jgi:glycosyltransferase involved in cell wall biosynthesis